MSDKTLHSSEALPVPGLTKFTAEWLESRMTIEIEARLELAPLLEKLNFELGTRLEPRPEGTHVTVIGPGESKALDNLSIDQLAELTTIIRDIREGKNMTVLGIGYIDGATAPNIRAADVVKKTAFIALDIPPLTDFRTKMGLPPKDFHVTLGYEGGDIHTQVVGYVDVAKGKKKEVVEPIAKKADPRFASYINSLKLSFGEISGKEKEKAAEKKPNNKPVEAPRVYDADFLRLNFGEYEREGKIPSGSTEDIISLILAGDASTLGKKYGQHMRHIRIIMSMKGPNE